MATENILMYCVREKGGDRQTLHEAIRQHSVKAAEQVKLYGKPNDLMERILGDETFGLDREELDKLMDPASFTGLAGRQTERYLREEVRPVLDKYRDELGAKVGITV